MLPIHSSFKINDCSLINFIELGDLELLEILDWRNADQTRRWMKNDQIINRENHLSYCHKLMDNMNVGHWRVEFEDKKIGVISLNGIDNINRQCEWGFYLNPRYFIGDASLRIFNCALGLFFEKFDLIKLVGSVKVENRSALILNDFFGMKEMHRFFIENIEYSHREMLKNDWHSNSHVSENLKTEFAKFIKSRNNNENRK